MLWCNVGFAVTKEDGPIANFLDNFLGPTIVIVIIYFIVRKIKSKKKSKQTKELKELKVSSSTQTTAGQKGTWETFFDGNLDLATSFWGFLIAGTFVVGLISGFMMGAYGKLYAIPLVGYTFFAVAGTWASAENYKKKKLSKQQSILWGILAQIFCILNVISLISVLVDMF